MKVDVLTREELISVVEKAYEWGREQIDLTDCFYGEPHWDGAFVSKPFKHYFFLAALAALLEVENALEVGTHFGGSAFSIARGMLKNSGRSHTLVTIDRTNENVEAYEKFPCVKKIVGDCFDPEVLQKVHSIFSSSIDLLHIDSTHTYDHTFRCFTEYNRRFHPRLVVFDDIKLNDGMKQLWKEICESFGEDAIDCTEQSMRGEAAGLGVLLLHNPR